MSEMIRTQSALLPCPLRKSPQPYWVNIYQHGPGFAARARIKADWMSYILDQKPLYRIKVIPKEKSK